MGISFQVEYDDDIDTYIKSSNTAIEVDGPSHFTSIRPYRPLGRTILKRKLLKMKGYRVVSIPFYEWYPLGHVGKIQYLQDALKK